MLSQRKPEKGDLTAIGGGVRLNRLRSDISYVKSDYSFHSLLQSRCNYVYFELAFSPVSVYRDLSPTRDRTLLFTYDISKKFCQIEIRKN